MTAWAERAVLGGAAAVALCVIGVFVAALAAAAPVDDDAVYVVGDPTVAVGAPWALRVGALSGRVTSAHARFVGRVNGVDVDASDDSFGAARVVIPRSVHVDVDGAIDGVPFAVAFDVPVAAVDDGFDRVVVGSAARGTLPIGDGLPRARLASSALAVGDAILVESERAAPFVQLFVGGRLVREQRGTAGLAVPADAAIGALVVVRVADSPLPSARGRALVGVVGGPAARGLSEDDLSGVAPHTAALPNLAPDLAAQRATRATHAAVAAAAWRDRFHAVCVVVVVAVAVVAAARARERPLLALGAVATVGALLLALVLMLRFAA